MIPLSEFVPGKRSCLRMCYSLFAVILAGLLLPAAAWAQVTYTGTAANQNFGSVAIGSTSAGKTFSFSVAAGTTVGSIGVVTQGAPNLDFTDSTGGTCTATTYASATTCTVDVIFKPRFAGERYGAVVFFSEAGNAGTVLGSVLIYGAGAGPEVVFSPGALRSLGGGFNNPYGVAVDGSGNVYVANASVYEMPPGCASSSCATTLGGGFSFAQDVAVDGSGNVYVADWGGSAVYEMPPGCASSSCVTELGGGITTPTAVAVDGSGNVYAAEWRGGAVKEMPPGCASSSCVTTLGGGFNIPSGVAVDGSGNVFVTDARSSFGLVKEMPPGCASSSCVTTLGGTFITPSGVAVDGSGNVYVADYYNGTVKEMPPGCASSSCVITLGSGFNNPGGGSVAVDGSGNVFVASYCISCNGAVYEMDRATPPTLSFPTQTYVGSTDTTDGTLAVQVQNIGNQALDFTALGYPADFSEASGDANACTGSTSLSPGLECDVPIAFTPENAGPLSESVTLTDNALNTTGAVQPINVSGTGIGSPATLTSPAPTSTLTGPSVTFTWSAGSDATTYYLSLGSTGVGSTNLFNTGWRTVTSWTATGLPTNGETIYARLTTNFNGTWVHADYTYTAATGAAITTPAAGSILTGPNITFNWSAATGATQYYLSVGSTGVGSSNVFNSGWRNVTSWTATGLPTNGQTLYVRLSTDYSGIAVYADYTYTAATAAMLTTPTPGTRLSGSIVTFDWTAGTAGATQYYLSVGSTGVGSTNIFNSGWRDATSWEAWGLPTNGETLYVRLSTDYGGTAVHNDYIYIAQ